MVGVAATGEAALAEIRRLRPDLVLLDVHLPDRTGIDVLRELRAGGDDTGVVMVTAAREAETVRAAAAGGAAHYLVKPFEYDDLRARLDAFRAAHRALAEGEPAGQDDIDAVFAPVVTDPPGGAAQGAQPAHRRGRARGAARAPGSSPPPSAPRRSASRASPPGRYLEHFVATGQVEVRLKYGGAGRPERRYRLRP